MFKSKAKKLVMAVMMGVMVMNTGMVSASPLQSMQDEIGTDKIAHFGAGYVASDILGRVTDMSYLERGLAVTGLAGLKEATDSKWDNKDFVATIAGGLANIGLQQLHIKGHF